MKFKQLVLSAAVLLTISNVSQAYVIAGNDYAVSDLSGSWSWDGFQHQEFRNALGSTANFGPGGVINESVSTVNLGTNINAASLATVDLFVSSWWQESQSSAYHTALLNFFYNGGDLMLLQDDPDRDGLGSALGVATTIGTFNPTPRRYITLWVVDFEFRWFHLTR